MTTDWSKFTVVDLRAELKRRGLPQTGKKADLVDRLANTEQPGEVEEEAPPAQEENHDDEAALMGAKESSLEPVDGADTTAAESHSHGLSEEATPSTLPQALTAGPTEPRANEFPSSAASLPSVATLPVEHGLQGDSKGDNGEEAPSSSEVASATKDIAQDTQSRKRRSRSPPLPSGDESRKRARLEETDTEMAGANDTNGIAPAQKEAPLLEEEQPKEQSSHAEVEAADDMDIKPPPTSAVEPEAPTEPSDLAESAPPASATDLPRDPTPQPISDRAAMGPSVPEPSGPSAAAPELEDRAVTPAVHPATSALYIKNFMRPLRDTMVRDHLVQLATPPGSSPRPDIIVDFYLDQIRTHSFVRLSSVSAASRVRSALHDRVWPDERNRKALRVDFIPPERVLEWADKEKSSTAGRGSSYRWEVVYEPDCEGNMVAKHEEVDAESTRQNVRPPAGPAADVAIPTGPSRSNVGIEGAPLGPRRDGARGARSRGRIPPGEGWESTRSGPPLIYRPVPDDLVRLRLRNMRSFYSTERRRSLGRETEINRYTFENNDAFVDRGKEVFVGIRPPHRERERERQRRTGGGGFGGFGGPRGPPTGPRPRNDRPLGGGGSRRDDAVPRSRFDGAPLPTFDGRPERSGRGFRGYRS